MNHPFIARRARIIFCSKRFRHSQTPLPPRRLRRSSIEYRIWLANPQSTPAHTKSTVDLGCETLIWVDNTPKFPLFPVAHTLFPPIRTRPPGASNRNQAKSNQKIIRTASLIWVEGTASSKTAIGQSRARKQAGTSSPFSHPPRSRPRPRNRTMKPLPDNPAQPSNIQPASVSIPANPWFTSAQRLNSRFVSSYISPFQSPCSVSLWPRWQKSRHHPQTHFNVNVKP